MRLLGHIAGAKAYSDKLSDSRDINLNVSFFLLREVTFNWSQLRFLSLWWIEGYIGEKKRRTQEIRIDEHKKNVTEMEEKMVYTRNN